jgi:hypothetical protein
LTTGDKNLFAVAMHVWQLTELSRVCIISLFIERQQHASTKRRDVMRTRIAAVLAVASIPLLASLMLGPSADASNLRKGRPGFTDLDNHYFRHRHIVGVSEDYGHPDPCWSLRLQRHRNAYWWWSFEDCLAYYNYNN